MNFEQAEQQFDKLAAQYNAGKINGEEFAEAVDGLSITDRAGRKWQIGLQSGKWYRLEGDAWVADNPSNSIEPGTRPRTKPKRGRRLLLSVLLIAVIAAFCLGTAFFANGGKLPGLKALYPEAISGLLTGEDEEVTATSTAELQATQAGDTMGETLLPGEGEATGEGETVTATPEPTTMPTSMPTATITVVPTATQTPLPPPPAYQPEVWQEQVNVRLGDAAQYTGDWEGVPDRDWEYEFLAYKQRNALLLQFSDPVSLPSQDGSEVTDLERSLTLAMPDADGSVSMVCRKQPEVGNYYALTLSRARWQLVKWLNGNRDVLAEGVQNSDFSNGEYGKFTFACAGERLTAWNEGGLLASVEDAAFSEGQAGLDFGIDGGVSIVYIFQDQMYTRVDGRDVGQASDTVRLGLLDVTLVGKPQMQDPMEESDYAGQPLASVRLRFFNLANETLDIGLENIYLVKGNERISALGFEPQSALDTVPLQLPLKLKANQAASGDLYFAGLAKNELGNGWQLVIDLRYEGLGEIRFEMVP